MLDCALSNAAYFLCNHGLCTFNVHFLNSICLFYLMQTKEELQVLEKCLMRVY